MKKLIKLKVGKTYFNTYSKDLIKIESRLRKTYTCSLLNSSDMFTFNFKHDSDYHRNLIEIVNIEQELDNL